MIFFRYFILATIILLSGCGKKPVPKPEIEGINVRRKCQYYHEDDSKLIPQQTEYNFTVTMKLKGMHQHTFPRTITAHMILDGQKKSMTLYMGGGINIISDAISPKTTTVYVPRPENLSNLNISEMCFEINILDGNKTIPYTLKCTPDMLDQIRSVQ